MSISFRTGQYVDPSGFPLAVVNVPALDPNTNISLTDNSYTWEENVTSADSSVVQSYVSSNGIMPSITASQFLVTNQTATLANDTSPIPLYYQHICRFYHYTYGNNPAAQVVITDDNGNVLGSAAYSVQAKRIQKYVYQITVLTSFRNPIGSSYKVQYNRCSSTGTSIYPNWTETLSVTPLFVQGSPNLYTNQYVISGPTNGNYSVTVPPVPVLTPITNVLGVSIANAPTIITNNATNAVDYTQGVIVTYTLTAISNNTYTIKRDYTPTGSLVNNYLQSATTNTWGSSPVNFSIATSITGIPGVTLNVHSDNALIPNDQASFQATRAYYYINITAYESIYLIKPVNELANDDWYMSVANGTFNRNMDNLGNEVPIGSGTYWQYSIPEYQTQVFASGWGAPYVQAIDERPSLDDSYTISLVNTPLFIDPSSVFNNPNNPGYPPSGFITIELNGNTLPETSVTDWDIDNGVVTVGQIINNSDNINVTYLYEEENYVYQGFVGSGNLYSNTTPLPYQDLNLNPSPGLGYGVYASGLIATIFARPNYNITASGTVNNPVLYHNFTGLADTFTISNASTWYFDHYDGNNGATSHKADTGQVLTFNGSAALSTAHTAFSTGASLFLNGTNSYVTAPYNSGTPLNFANNNFTIEFKVYLTSTTGQQNFIGQYVNGTNYWQVYKSASTHKLGIYFIYGGVVYASYLMTNNWSPVANTWYTLLFSRNGSNAIISINGTQQVLTTTTSWGTSTIPVYATTLNIGAVNGNYTAGYIDDMVVNTQYAYYPNNYYPYLTPYRYGQTDFNLGSVSLGPNCSINDVQIIDVRSRAGGLNTNGIANLSIVEQLDPESQFFWDVGYFDGQAVPTDGVIVVNVPSSVLVENGGSFNKDEVRKRIYKHMALGEYAIIQYI